MSGTVSDNVAVTQVQIFNAGTSLGYATVTNGTWTFNPALAPNNYNSLSVTATDEAGNTLLARDFDELLAGQVLTVLGTPVTINILQVFPRLTT